MDTLFVDEASRGQGIGSGLLDYVIVAARHLGLQQIQWQTPAWNGDAIRFYERFGASATPKTRFVLEMCAVGS